MTLKTIHKEYVIDNYLLNNKSTITISKELGISKATVRNILIENSIKRRNYSESKRTFLVNENYFKQIDSEEKAYYLGFIYGDGCNSPHNNTLTITSSIIDKEHLQKLLSIICPEKMLKSLQHI